MTLEEFGTLYTYLAKAYGKEVDDTEFCIWYDFFKKNTSNEFKKAIVEVINERRTFPSIADVKEKIIKQEDEQVNLKADEEWEKVIDSVRRYGWPRPQEALDSLQPITRNIVKRLGYEEICRADAERKMFLRSAFIKSFDSEKEDLLRYKKSNDIDTLEMRLIQERNKDTLTSGINSLVRRISDVVDEEEHNTD